MTILKFPERLTPKEAAKELGVAPETLAIWRCTKRYPLSYVKIGRKVFYRVEDIIAFIESRTVKMEDVSCQ